MDRRRWGRSWGAVAVAGMIAAGVSCSFLIGDFKECTTEADCANRVTDGGAFSYICGAAGYCLPIDRRCTILGPKTGDAVEWGSIQPRTLANGTAHQWGPSWESAIELFIKELNPPQRQGIHNRPIRVYACDTQSNPNAARELAEYLVNTVKVPVIISDGSADTINASRVTVPAGVLLVAGAATSPDLTSLADLPTDGGSIGLVWRTAPSDALQGPIIARQILDAGTTTPKAFVFARDDTFGQGLSGLFSSNYPVTLPDGGSAQSKYFVNPNDLSTVTPALNAAEAFRPDVMVVIGFPAELVAIVNGSANRPGLANATWFFTQNAKFPGLFTQVTGGVPLEGSRGTSPSPGYDNSEPSLFLRPKFEQDYAPIKFNSVVDLANMYDAAFLVALATDYSISKDGNANGKRMSEAFTMFSHDAGRFIPLVPSRYTEATSELNAGRPINVEGASGHLDFNNVTGEAPADYEVWKIVNNQFVTQYLVPP